MPDYRRNHYVPKWYQYRFFEGDEAEKKFCYLDLKPETVTLQNGKKYERKSLFRWGPPKCFFEDDLYTTRFRDWKSTEIEEKFFGRIDEVAPHAIEHWSKFNHPNWNNEALHNLMLHMSIQKLRTPKGLEYIANLVKLNDKNSVLFKLQELQSIFCALWTECIWSIVDASGSETKFIISDHPVTVYNQACFPFSDWCRGYRDPDIWLNGTYTLFPLSLDKMLVLTNLSWIRNPYDNPLKERPHPVLFRPTMFNFQSIQTGRILSEKEVVAINFIVKQRAFRYIASAKKDWLYPEKECFMRWDEIGKSYMLMPDPRGVSFSTNTFAGYENWGSCAFDEYGRMPQNANYDDKKRRETEWNTSLAFKGEYARLFGPKRRGLSFELGKKDRTEDNPDFHAYHLGLEQKYKPKKINKRRRLIDIKKKAAQKRAMKNKTIG